jgi:hypothetical protein
MAERALITSADTWQMTDEKTGEIRRGLSVWYLNDYREDTGEAFGFKPTKVSADISLKASMADKLPGLFELEYGSRPGAQGKATLTLIGVKFVQAVDLFGSMTPAKAS